MNYYRKIEKPINDLKYKMQIAALILNMNKNKNDIKEIDKKFNDYYNNEHIDNSINRVNRLINIFNENLTNHINDYKLNVPNNLKSDITNIKSDIEIINTNMLQYLNKTIINEKKLDTHSDIINANLARLDKIKYNIDDIYILKIDEIKDLNFTSNIDKIEIFNALFNSTNFKAGGYIELFCQFLFKYPITILLVNLLYYSNFIMKMMICLMNILKFKVIAGDNNEEILNKRCFYALRLLNDHDEIRLKIYVKRINENDIENILIKMINTTESNKLILKYIRYNDWLNK